MPCDRLGRSEQSSLRKPQREDAAPDFVTIFRTNGFRRLHMSHGCAIKQDRCIETQPVYHLTEGIADAICKLQASYRDFNSSDSGSETAQAGAAM